MVVLYVEWMPVDAVLYAGILSLPPTAGVAGYDVYQFYKKHHAIQRFIQAASPLEELLPPAKDTLEMDYQEAIAMLMESQRKKQSEADAKRTDMLEYYTMWVHQIKTPIAALRLLLQSDSGTQTDELLDQVFQIEQYVEMVLSYQRLESATNDLVIREYDLDKILRQSIRKHARLFIRKKIKLQYEETHAQVLTDEKWLGFVIDQILGNAIKYTNHGSISLSFDEERRVLTIQDTGIGISAEDLPRVFENGYTGYNGRTNRKSTGIGLYLCKRIIRMLSHTIAIESTQGIGTSVEITIPARE